MRQTDVSHSRGFFRAAPILIPMLLVAVLLTTASSAPGRQAYPNLNALLEKAAKYCEKLSHSILNFACRERIEEWLHPDAGPRSTWARRSRSFVYVGRRETHTYIYDFQLIRDRAGAIRESRTLLREDKNELRVPDTPLKTHLFWHANVVMGPLGLLSRERQADHAYRILREEKVGKERAVVIEAVPKPGVQSERLVGTIWLKSEDAGVLKIEWDPSSIANYAGVEETAKRFQMTPRIVLTSEYAFEKNGIRFPSRYTVKEIYIRGGRHFQRSGIDVIYDEYKFFTVETQVIF